MPEPKLQHDLPPEQELALIRAARDGDASSFERLIQPYLPEIERLVWGKLPRRDGHLAEEAVQDVLITAWKALSRYVEAYRFRNYIFGITREIIKRRLAGRRREIPTDWERDDSPLSGEPDPRTYRSVTGRLRNLVGVDRFPRPDASMLRSAVLGEMLEAMLGYGGYPHQQIAFAYSIVLWGKPKPRRRTQPQTAPERRAAREKVPITGDPDRVVRELSSTELRASGRDFQDEVASRGALRAEVAARAFAPLIYRLGLRGTELFSRDRRSARLFSQLSATIIGHSLLEQYFGKDPRKSIADWTERVKTRTRQALQGDLDPGKSPLPWPSGHEKAEAGT
ncbi:MAG: hypothetical protein KAY32_08180 [Candidatus Eisenbacteria sp.]|nr:hypothetical protein [Candidatus Eisenbacteria bacterium]